MMCMDVYMHEYDMYKYLRTSGGVLKFATPHFGICIQMLLLRVYELSRNR